MKKKKNFNKIMTSTITASVVVSTLATGAPNANAAETTFKDVQSDAYFYEAVNSLHARHIISGYEDGTFRPNETLTRAQVAKIIALALNLDTTNITDPEFKDVSKGHSAYKYIAALANKGIITGFEGEYKPNHPVTRAQAAKILSLAYSFDIKDSQQLVFTDVKQGDWFKNYVGALIENDITTGTTPTTFSPNKSVTRGQIAAFVYRSESQLTPVQVNETIAAITNETLVTSERTYTLSDEQKKWINPNNLAALEGARLALTSKGNKIEKIQSVELIAKGTSSTDTANPYANHIVFDGNDASIDANVTVNGDYITIKNITIKADFHVGQGVENSFFSEFLKVEGKTTIDDSLQIAKLASTKPVPVAINNARGKVVFSEFQLGDVGIDKNADVIFLGTSTTVGEIIVNSNVMLTASSLSRVVIAPGATDVTINSNVSTLEIMNKESKVTIGAEMRIGNLILPSGLKPTDVIQNYDAIKERIELINGRKDSEPTPAVPSGGGGSGITDTTAPMAVTGVSGSSQDIIPLAVGGLQNTISWTANTASDLSHYEVFRSTNPNGTTGATKVSSNIGKGVTTFTDTSVVAGTIYYYTVYAVDTSNNRSAISNVVMVTTVTDSFMLAPPAPTGLQGLAPTVIGDDGKITGLDITKVYQYKLSTNINWTDVPLLATEITGLSAGIYEVRFAANGSTPASLSTPVSVPSTGQSQAPSSIQLINYETPGNDVVAVSTLPIGSIINVYDASTNGNIIGSLTVTTVSQFNMVNILGGFPLGLDKVYVTVTESGKTESARVEKGVPTTFPNAPTLNDIMVTDNAFGADTVKVKLPSPISDYIITAYDVLGNQLTWSLLPDGIDEKTISIFSGFANGTTEIDVAIVKVADNGTQYAESLRTRVSVEALGTLTVTSLDDPLSNDKVTITVTESADAGNEFAYKVFDDVVAVMTGKPSFNTDVSSWDALPPDGKITAAAGKFVVVVERTTTDKLARKMGQVIANTVANNPLLETVTIDGKDGVSSQDGQMETIRLKFSANIDPATVNINSFTVPGYTVESIKVTDKNGRTPRLSDGVTPDSRHTQGENQYITIRVAPVTGTHFTPTVIQNPSVSIVDMNGVHITGINVTAVDQAAPVIISSAFVDNDGSNSVNAGDKLTVTFSEEVNVNSSNLAELVDDFTLSNQTNPTFAFAHDDSFELLGNTVTVTLGATTVSKIEPNTTITISDNGNNISLRDAASNKAKPQKEFVDENSYSISKTIDITNIPLSTLPAPTAIKAQGTNAGTIKLTGLTSSVTYEYIVDDSATTSASTNWAGAVTAPLIGITEIDNIQINAGQYVHIRVAAPPGQPTNAIQDIGQIELIDIKPAAAPDIYTSLPSNAGFTKLYNFDSNQSYEYFVDNNNSAADNAPEWATATPITGVSSQEIQASAPQYIHIRIKATAEKPASYIKSLPGVATPP
ncbi:S-layer homology domain-containing protein [Metasolibacillus sp.]|uniref:S-layer homology domain-containing protein n=1 Tax=Metasolibacillus sp. TaxID=2703680 RepID=UPI0025D39D1B|nr:S-layer homology domain-containing protein [Metasolibacillus sp.]MCT6924896.1 S-layer homology domain-containing protein [Metasolibacillus sp.]MCT6941164.1 S-layer homology domain-containing protein [Metasolibacillus sp.]